MDRRQLLDSILRLAGAEERSERSLRAELRLVRSRLEDELGQTVRPAEAAELLGVSQTALAKWLDKREISSVITPQGRREIPIAEVVDLSREVEEARRRGRERPVSAVIRDRRRHAVEAIDVDRVLPPRRGRTHRDAELQSLAYHRLVAERLTPELVDEARERVERWERTGRLHPQWAREWRNVLAGSEESIKRVLASSAQHARRLRQTSPFAGVLTEQERRRLIEAIEARG
jgi:predicted transcriptional regulator